MTDQTAVSSASPASTQDLPVDREPSGGRYARVPRVGIANVVRLLEVAQRSGSSPTVAQVANGLDQTINSGAFRMRTAAAGIYGAVESERGRLKITDRGRRLIDPTTRRDAAVEAFFAVDVFERLYRKYEGANLPTPSGIEGELRESGVNPRLLPDIRRVLTSTAEAAGLFEMNPRRLTIPPGEEFARSSAPVAESDTPLAEQGRTDRQDVVGRSDSSPVVHSLIARLVEQLPPITDQVDVRRLQRWLGAAKVTIELLYEVDLADPS